ncbi:hypothetical protein VW23_027485 [Devosia insulae DS-56]|uniref:Uncharacterized protein n=2 Tax=Devosia insulae TaxID=408174 RepID=A0A1E5XK70_9HYPH|nr:hypothetical protein VW23_027485 [Devosia insulae DS-56]
MTQPVFLSAIAAMPWLDLLKVVYFTGKYAEQVGSKRDYIQSMQELFKSTRLNWEMDDHGGIHPLRDTAYAAQRASVIAGLSEPRFANAAAAMARFVDAYDSAKPDNKLAINHVFDAAEALFKLRYQPTPPDRLTTGTAGQYLGKDFPRPKAQHEDESHLKRANSAMVAGFAGWVEACQQYRHELRQPDSDEQPPNELTELLVSAGMSYVRWLVRIDRDA